MVTDHVFTVAAGTSSDQPEPLAAESAFRGRGRGRKGREGGKVVSVSKDDSHTGRQVKVLLSSPSGRPIRQPSRFRDYTSID